MQLGVNFEPNENAAFGFDRGGVNALRPRLVRLVLFEAAEVINWIRSAQSRRLKILWCLPIESIGISASILAARIIANHGLDVTAGVELGHAPWFVKQAPRTFCHALEQVADVLTWTTEGDEASTSGLRFAFSKDQRPLLVGTGYDGGREASAWIAGFNSHARSGRWQFRHRCTGLSVHAIAPGRPWRWLQLTGLAANVQDRYGWPLAVTRVGWQTGQVLTWPSRIREGWRRTDGGPRELPRLVSANIRARWLQDAYQAAGELDASHFVLEADRSRPGVNHWGAFDPSSSRPDPVWHKLTWIHAHTPPAELVDTSDAVH